MTIRVVASRLGNTHGAIPLWCDALMTVPELCRVVAHHATTTVTKGLAASAASEIAAWIDHFRIAMSSFSLHDRIYVTLSFLDPSHRPRRGVSHGDRPRPVSTEPPLPSCHLPNSHLCPAPSINKRIRTTLLPGKIKISSQVPVNRPSHDLFHCGWP